MRAAIRIAILALMSSAVAATDAAAALGWLEKLSGPGPFKGKQYAFTLTCYGPKGFPPASTATPAQGGATTKAASEPELVAFWDCWKLDPTRRANIGIDIAGLATNENPLTYSEGQTAPGVNAFLFVPYTSISVAEGVELGVGFGFVRFTDRDGSNVDFSSTKALIQPIRLTVKPLAPFFESTRWNALQFAFNGTLLPTIRDRDFGAVRDTFREPTDLLWQTELRIDLGELVFAE